MKTIIVIAGATATGKTEVAINLAKIINAEIISADSRQIYKNLNIGTNKPTQLQLKTIKHHLISIVDINSKHQFNAGNFAKLANKKIKRILYSKKTAIISGGTGLYIKSLIDGLIEIKNDLKLRKKILNQYKKYGLKFLYNKLEKLDPETAKIIDKNNPVRVIRAIEICLQTGKKFSDLKKLTKKSDYKYIIFGLYTDRNKLYARINERVDIMINNGLNEEVEKLVKKFSFKNPILQSTIGYKEIIGYLNGEYSKDIAIELIKQNTRKYAKRQMTWFNKDKRIIWMDIDNDPLRKILNYLKKSDILYPREQQRKSTLNRH
ncbi:MAG: tRNA (adenosine(37)-N6)-dimethylallyltransferase MiaA [Elusimicrobia bacterium RIFOXYD2_FULL_34_15]|nr:MAG: tRNA (adenosine(37)-N6)-dimethylallyltransferase MiaA [Elusimicrobia bacterium RIFOXYD2_FULL_34_15]